MIRRRAPFVFALLAAATLTMSGCGGAPTTPATSTPLFANEDEAFAAAEKTYRAYVDALNRVDLSDPETFEAVFAYTTGEANADERKSLSQMSADRWTVSGDSELRWFRGLHFEASEVRVSGRACLDVGRVSLIDEAGKSQVHSNRRPVYALEIEFVASTSTATALVIAASQAVEDTECAT